MSRGAGVSVAADAAGLSITAAAALPTEAVLAGLQATPEGLSSAEVTRRLAADGPNVVARRRGGLRAAVIGQLRSPLLLLLFATAAVSEGVGERTNAVIIILILLASAGLGVVNDYRAERTAQALSAGIQQRAQARRDGAWHSVPAAELVAGDVVSLKAGEIVAADLRLLAAEGLTCDESVLTGEALPADKRVEPVEPGSPLAELASCALMGTVISGGRGTGVVVATGVRTEFGRIALGLQTAAPETAFQAGLRQFSGLLARIAFTVTLSSSSSTWCSDEAGSSRCCSRPPSRWVSRHSSCLLWSVPASPTAPASSAGARYSSNAWSPSRISETWTRSSRTRRAPLPLAASGWSLLWRRREPRRNGCGSWRSWRRRSRTTRAASSAATRWTSRCGRLPGGASDLGRGSPACGPFLRPSATPGHCPVAVRR